MFVAGLFLFKVNTITSDKSLWNVSLTLLYYHWTGNYLMDLLVPCLACHWVMVSVSFMFCNHRHTPCRANNGLCFLVLSLNVVHKWFSKIWYCSRLCQFCKCLRHSSKTRPIKSVKSLLWSKSVILVTNEFKLDQGNQIFK